MDVQTFYEGYPYPRPIDNLDAYRTRWQDPQRRRADHYLHWPGRPYAEDRSILVAGCGTSQAAKHAIRWPTAQVTGIDFSRVVRGLTISDTGLRRVKFGEGIYVGSAVSNWCDITGCEPDRSDRNVVVANTISRTAAESVDIKEGTTGGVLADNTFDGTGMRGETDSWVDVKGNGWLVQANHGTTTKRSGFEVNLQADGWGTANTFDANTADVDGPGYGYELRHPTDDPAARNRVTCTNTAFGATEGLTNTTCA